MGQTVLSQRELNRATLHRQMLLERRELPVLAALRRLGGLNAQHGESPDIALWSRLSRFTAVDLSSLLEHREVVRSNLMRGTLHLVASRDYPLLNPALSETLRRVFRGFFPREGRELDESRLRELALVHLTGSPLPYRELERLLSAEMGGLRHQSLSFAAKSLLPLVQVPSVQRSGEQTWALAGEWLGRDMGSPERGLRRLLLHYLRAFGPASQQDFRQWSGLGAAQANAALSDLGRRLIRYRDATGTVLHDLPGMAHMDPMTPAPPRLLPRWDNLLLAHQDRTRVLPERYRARVIQRDGRVLATFLLDGFVAGLWRIDMGARQATLHLEPFEDVPANHSPPLQYEALRLVRHLRPGAARHAVELRPPE